MSSPPRSAVTPKLRTPLDAIRYDDSFPLWVTQRDTFKDALATRLVVPYKSLTTPFAGRPDTAGFSVDSSPPSSSPPASRSHDDAPVMNPALPVTAAQAASVGLASSLLPLTTALAVPEAERGPRETLFISRFLEREPFFTDIDSKTIQSVAKLSCLAHFFPGDTIIDNGDAGDFMFVMFSGSISVTYKDGIVKNLRAPLTFCDTDFSADSVPPVSIVATSHIYSLQVLRLDYSDITRSFVESRRLELAEWLIKLPFFKGWSHTRINKVVNCAVVRNLREGEVITSEGSRVHDIYFVRRGTLSLSRIERTDKECRWPETVEAVEAVESAVAMKVDEENQAAAAAAEKERRDHEDSPPASPKAGDKPAVPSGVVAAATTSPPRAAEFNPLPAELLNTYSGTLLTSRIGPAALRNVTSKGRLAALAASSMGVELLPIPVLSPRGAETVRQREALSREEPTTRDRGWGAGFPGGSLAFSPRTKAPSRASAIEPVVTYVDTKRRLPVGVAFHSTEVDVKVGFAAEYALLGITEVLHSVPSPFSITCAEARTQIIVVPGHYLLATPDIRKKATFTASGASSASQASLRRLDAATDGGAPSAIAASVSANSEVHQPRGLANVLKDCVSRLVDLGVILSREEGKAQRVALASVCEVIALKSGKTASAGSRTRAASERAITEEDRVGSMDAYLPVSVPVVRKCLVTAFRRLGEAPADSGNDKENQHADSSIIDELTQGGDFADGSIEGDGVLGDDVIFDEGASTEFPRENAEEDGNNTAVHENQLPLS